MGFAWLTHPVVLLSVGGALGTNARFWLGVWVAEHFPHAHFPLATFLINVVGSFVLGMTAGFFHDRNIVLHEQGMLLFGVGFCGGYTTFSTFALETFRLLREYKVGWAVANVVGSVVAAVIAAAVGMLIAERLRR